MRGNSMTKKRDDVQRPIDLSYDGVHERFGAFLTRGVTVDTPLPHRLLRALIILIAAALLFAMSVNFQLKLWRAVLGLGSGGPIA